jgi:CRISPR type I-E-associated protein CasB/Cse2
MGNAVNWRYGRLEAAVSEEQLLLDARARAQLRRADPWEVRGAYEWVRRVRSLEPFREVSEARLMALAPLAAEVREHSPKGLGEALRGTSEARFRRLLASDRDDIVDQLHIAVRILGREVNVADLIATALYWGDERRRKVARDYFSLEESSESG